MEKIIILKNTFEGLPGWGETEKSCEMLQW